MSNTQEKPNAANLRVSINWIKERESIRRKKEAGLPPPWTKDTLIAGTRWCNVRRMDDKVSKWLLDFFYRNRDGMRGRELVTAASLARFINRPETLEALYPNGYTKFDYDRCASVLERMRKDKQQVFTGVYIINGAGGEAGEPKWKVVLNNLAAMHRELTPTTVDTSSMQATHANLMRFKGMGSFMAGQVVADLRHIYPGKWDDRMSWAPQGPGSSKGLNFVFNTPGLAMKQADFLTRLHIYMDAVRSDKSVAAIWEERKLEAHDLQNCLCETSKMARLLQGGRSKNRYTATAQQMTLL